MSLQFPIYLDNNATTRLDPRVLERMTPYFTEEYGNASSANHTFGWAAEEAVNAAAESVAGLLGASAEEILFTSGATESNNLAIKGVAEMYVTRGKHLITTATEHRAVLDPMKYLDKRGWDVTILPVDEYGAVDPQAVAEAITDRTVLVSVIAANNEIGTLNSIAEIGQVTRDEGVLLHTDATQQAGKLAIDVDGMNVDLLSLSAHKMYGPKGVGALYVRGRSPRVRLTPQLHGGGQQRGLRSGTLNVPGIVGLGAAAELCREEMDTEAGRQAELLERFEQGVLERLPDVHRNGHPTRRLPNTSNLSFAYVEGEGLVMRMKDLAVSTGSACSSADDEPDHVLAAMGVSEHLVRSSIRFSLGRFNTAAEIDFAVDEVCRSVEELRKLSPVSEIPREEGSTS